MSRIIVLTGERGVGKSTVCQEAVTLAQAAGYTCGGILTLSRPDDVRLLVDVSSGDQRQLTLEPSRPDASEERTVVCQGRFCFDPEVLRWGSIVLTQASPCDLLVVDELGPLEIERGEGWGSAFNVLRRGNFALALVVVRPELVMPAQLRLPCSATTVLTVTLHNRDDLPNSLLDMLRT